MTAKEYLSQLKALDVKIGQLIAERDRLRSSVLGRGIAYDGMPTQKAAENRQEAAVVKYLFLEDTITEKIDEYIDTTNRIIGEIHSIEGKNADKYIRILHDHYVPDDRHKVKTLEEIAVEMQYNYTWVCELHGQALIAFEKCRRKPKA